MALFGVVLFPLSTFVGLSVASLVFGGDFYDVEPIPFLFVLSLIWEDWRPSHSSPVGARAWVLLSFENSKNTPRIPQGSPPADGLWRQPTQHNRPTRPGPCRGSHPPFPRLLLPSFRRKPESTNHQHTRRPWDGARQVLLSSWPASQSAPLSLFPVHPQRILAQSQARVLRQQSSLALK